MPENPRVDGALASIPARGDQKLTPDPDMVPRPLAGAVRAHRMLANLKACLLQFFGERAIALPASLDVDGKDAL